VPANTLVEQYVSERDQLLNTVQVLKNTTLDRGGDPSDADLEVMEKAYARIDQLDKFIKTVGEDRQMDEETRLKLLNPTPPVSGALKYRSGGEMVWDCLHANFGTGHNHEDQEAKRRWDLVMKRAAQHMGTDAAQTTPVAGDLGGLYVVPVVGPVVSLFPAGQPFLSAMGRRPAPSSMTFTRPRIVDPAFGHGPGGPPAAPRPPGSVGVDLQPMQKGELASAKFDVKVDTLSLSTVGGYLNVSQQLMQLQAGAWDIIVGQMQQRLAWAGEYAAIQELALTTAVVPLPPGSTSDVVLTALFDAAALVYQNTYALPSWIAYGPLGWAMLGSLVDLAGRPLFPFLGAANAFGQANLGDFNLGPLGLQQIVTPGITDENIYMGNAFGFEAYVYSFPILEAVEPSVLGRQLAVAEAMCFYRPTTVEETAPGAGDAQKNGIVRIGP
jgi:hypothetical protein